MKSVWKGPYEDGITQSMLNRYLFCKHRFYLYAIKGLQEERVFNSTIVFGNLWHEAEEALAAKKSWKTALMQYYGKCIAEYPDDQKELIKWFNIVKMLFSVYVSFWKDHEDVKNREPLYQEEVLREALRLPSGRKIILTGKVDAADWIGKGSKKKIFLQENKTRGKIDFERVTGELPNTLQPMMYCKMLQLRGDRTKEFNPKIVSGVRYNIVRRPFSFGCKYNFRQKKGREVWNDAKTKKIRRGQETEKQFYERIQEAVEADPSYWFMRWKVNLIKQDFEKFNSQVLYPLLENVCDWWDFMQSSSFADPFESSGSNGLHMRTPFGIYNPIREGWEGSYYEYLRTGSTDGLVSVPTLFPELQTDETNKATN